MFQKGFIFTAFLTLSFSLFAQVNPSIKWKKITLDRFELIYDSGQQSLAEIYAARLSGVLQRLSPYFEQIPEKTTIVLSDQTDFTNGFATPLPYPMIMIYPTLPTIHESIGEYGDWASEILLHEYTHILAMNQRRGAVANLEKIFGSIMVPNLLLPRWWHEGLAVEMETRFSNHGRLLSTNQEAWLRSYVLEGTLKRIDLAEANEVSHPDWPYGARPYLFGSILWSELFAENSDSVKTLSLRHGGRFPYFLETPALDELGMTYADFFEKTKNDLKNKIQLQTNSLLQTPATNAEPLNLPFLDIESPQISPDGLKLAFIGKDDANRRSLQILIRESAAEPFQSTSLRKSATSSEGESSDEMKAPMPRFRDGPPGGSISGFSWHPDSSKIVYDKIDSIKTYQEFSQLWIYDLKTEKTEKLQNVVRAREPSFSPDGKQIAFVGIHAGKTNLSLYDLEKNEAQILFAPPLQTRVGSPIFQDHNHLYFSFRESGEESLLFFDLQTKTYARIQTSLSNLSVEKSNHSKFLALSDDNGVRNAYLTDFQSYQPLTHSLTGITGAALDKSSEDLYITEQTSSGLKLKRLMKAKQNKLPFPLPSTGGKLYATRYQKPALTVSMTEIKTEPEDYSALPYMLPRYWLPLIYWNSFSSYFAIMTSANDPLQKHNWNLYGTYDFSSGKLGYDFSYLNQTADWPLFFNAIDQTVSFSSGNTQRSQLSYAQITFPNSALGTDWLYGFGLNYLLKQDQSGSSTQAGPSAFLNYMDFAQSGVQISPETGQGGSVRLTSYLPLTNMTTYNQYDLSYVRYFSSILPKHHAVMWKAQWAYLDRVTSSSNFVYTQAQPSQNNTSYPIYLMRGYPTGAFQGRNLFQTTLEYRLPFAKLYKGWDLTPFYMKQLHGAFILDGVATDGYAYDSNNRFYRRTMMEKNYWSVGAEAKIDTTVGYHFPMMFYFGFYYPLDQSLNAGANFALGLYL